MKNHPRSLTLLLTGGIAAVLLAACATTPLPQTSPEGLVLVPKPKNADVVYLLPGGDFSGYDKLMVEIPQISFRSGWKADQNTNPTIRRITDDDMMEMIARGKQLFAEEFPKELKKRGWTVVPQAGKGVLLVHTAIINLDVAAPDPDNMAGIWSKTYTEEGGEATLAIELYDSVSGQLLARAVDTKSDDMNSSNWRFQRDQMSNSNDARWAFQEWAAALANGLDAAKATASAAHAAAPAATPAK